MYRGLSFVASGTKQLSVDAYTGLSGVLYDFASESLAHIFEILPLTDDLCI